MTEIRFRRAPRLAARCIAFLFLILAAPALATAQAEGEVYGADEVTTPPKLVSMTRTAALVKGSYPAALRSAGVTGTVQLVLVIGADGKVEPGSVQVLAASVATLGEAAKKVAPQIEFTPARMQDRAVRTRVILPIVYKP
jgi:protein TonB